MKSILKVKKEYLYMAFILLLIAGIYGYGITRIYGMSIYPDEFGYWASAASVLGWDWSQIASLGSYYSFGYSLILLPILKFSGDSVIAYKIAVTVNVVLLCVAFFLLMGMVRRLFPEVEKERGIFFAGITVLYPAWLYYMQTTLAEAMLIFMVILTAYLLLRLMEKPRVITGILLALAIVYTYTLHMRAVGVVIACGLTILLWGILTPGTRKKVCLFLVILSLALMATFVWKEMIQQSVYSNSGKEVLNVNDYGGQLNKLKVLFTTAGIKNFAVNMAGKFLYMGFASGGLVYWGLGWCIVQGKELVQNIRRKDKGKAANWLGIYILLMAAAQLGICGIYTVGAKGPDWIIYGRYIELIIPVLSFFGVCMLNQSKHIFRGQGLILGIYSIMAGVCLFACKDMGAGHIRGEHSALTSIFIGEGEVAPKVFFGKVWLAGIVVGGVITVLIWYSRQKKIRTWILMLIMVAEILTGIKISQLYVYSSNQNMRMDITMTNVLRERDDLGEQILFLKEGSDKWIGFLQMQLREQSIIVIEPAELEGLDTQNTLILAYYNSKYLDKLEELYKHQVMADVYNVFY